MYGPEGARVVDRTTLVATIRAAFATVPYPGDDDIVHCEYDERWGGRLAGPCQECSEIVDHFRGTTNTSHRAAAIRGVSFALGSFTPAALLYWLPAFLIGCVAEPDEGPLDILEFRFRAPGTPEDEQWQRTRLPCLSDDQLAALVIYFEYQETVGSAYTTDARSAISVLRQEVQRRHA